MERYNYNRDEERRHDETNIEHQRRLTRMRREREYEMGCQRDEERQRERDVLDASIAQYSDERPSTPSASASQPLPSSEDEGIVVIPRHSSGPGEINLVELLRDAAERGISPENITAERVLDISANEVQRLRRASQQQNNQGHRQATTTINAVLPDDVASDWEQAGVTYNHSDGAHVALRNTTRADVRNRIAFAIGEVSNEKGFPIVFEECRPAPGERTSFISACSSTSLANAGFLHLRFGENQFFTDMRRIDGLAVMQDPSVANASASELITVDGVKVGRLRDGGARVDVNPFLSAPGTTLTAASINERRDIFAKIVQAVVSKMENPPVYRAAPSREAQLQEAIAVIDLIPGFVSTTTDHTQRRKQALASDISIKGNEIEALRSQLMQAVRAKTELEQDLAALSDSAGGVSMERISESLVHVNRIRTRIGAVRDIQLSTLNNAPALHITFHPVVLEDPRTRDKHLMDNLRFKMPMQGAFDITWDYFSAGSPRGPRSPHPHVSTRANNCWGTADVPLRQAWERKDYATMVMVLASWCSVYNETSPHVDISEFPSTRHALGWHPELPIGLST